MPDLASLTNLTAASTDPDICACLEQLDATIANITSAYQRIFDTLTQRTDQSLSSVTTVLQQVMGNLTQLTTGLLSQVSQQSTTVSDSLSAQTLNVLTELVLLLQRSGIPVPSLGQSSLMSAGGQGVTNVSGTAGTIASLLGSFAGSGTILPGPQTGGGTTNGGTGTVGGQGTGGSGIGAFGGTGPGGTTVPGYTGTPTPVPAVDRVIIVNGDGTFTPANLGRDSERSGVVYAYPTADRLTPYQLDNMSQPSVTSDQYGSPLQPVAPVITPGLAGAGVGPTSSAGKGGISFIQPSKGVPAALPGVANGIYSGSSLVSIGSGSGPVLGSDGSTGTAAGPSPSPLDASFQQLQASVPSSQPDGTPLAPAELGKTDLIVADPSGKNFTITGSALVQLYNSAGDKLDYTRDTPILVQLVQLLIPGGQIIGQAATAQYAGVAGIFDPPGSNAPACPPIQITLNPSFGTGVPQGANGSQCCPNPVGIEQPYSFRFEQRQNPWFRDAVEWGSEAFKQFVTATSELEYRAQTDPIIMGKVVPGEED